MKQRLTINIIDGKSGKEIETYLYIGENLMDAIIREGLSIPSYCGGMGSCGKCIIRLVDGHLDITSQDKKALSADKLGQGYRLACMAYPRQACSILINLGEDREFKVVTKTLGHGSGEKSSDKKVLAHAFAITIDIGTTTLVLALLDLANGKIINNYTSINPQRAYGVDVISRIKASQEGKQDLLSKIIRDELIKGIGFLLKGKDIGLDRVQRIVIAGNTTMIHLLMSYSCAGLGAYPFNPVNLGLINTYSDELFAIPDRIPIVILPCISAFVGGDITAGLLACGFERANKPCLFIDMGTNGEMALGNSKRVLVTGTAAGPAFEGGNISCGVASVSGAISSVYFIGEKLGYQTINNVEPLGLCGTVGIELVYELLKKGVIDSSGLLVDPYFDTGYPIAGMKFTQADIRELQLAKAAIRAGVEILTKTYGISIDDLDRVYIAGGFGYYMDIEKAAGIGLLPDSLIKKTEAVGNTSLSGAIMSVTDPQANDKIDHIISVSEEIHLSNHEDFNDIYVQYMSF